MGPYDNRPETEIRLREVERRMLAGEHLPAVRKWAEEHYNLGDRQAREICRTAARRIADCWEVDRQELLALRLCQLEQLAQRAIERDQLGVALGAWRHADDLICLSAKYIKPASLR